VGLGISKVDLPFSNKIANTHNKVEMENVASDVEIDGIVDLEVEVSEFVDPTDPIAELLLGKGHRTTKTGSGYG